MRKGAGIFLAKFLMKTEGWEKALKLSRSRPGPGPGPGPGLGPGLGPGVLAGVGLGLGQESARSLFWVFWCCCFWCFGFGVFLSFFAVKFP